MGKQSFPFSFLFTKGPELVSAQISSTLAYFSEPNIHTDNIKENLQELVLWQGKLSLCSAEMWDLNVGSSVGCSTTHPVP